MNEEYVILVDENDKQIGVMPKLEAHKKAVLHRAFSVFIFNDKHELMLQQRALKKYHSPGLWTNTCCSHQREGESNIEAGKRRLQEERQVHHLPPRRGEAQEVVLVPLRGTRTRARALLAL